MARFFLIVCFVVLAWTSHGQIIYDLPETVVKKIDEKISVNGNAKCVIILSKRDSSKYSISIDSDFSSSEGSKIFKEKLVDQTNRFVKVGEKMIPLITWDDIYLADYGDVYYPEAKNEKRRKGKRKIDFISDAPLVVFDLSGKIY